MEKISRLTTIVRRGPREEIRHAKQPTKINTAYEQNGNDMKKITFISKIYFVLLYTQRQADEFSFEFRLLSSAD